MKLLSIVFSFRNEEGNLKELVERVHTCLDKITNWNYEAIFVNDDSSDNSENILLELQKKYPIRIINMSRNFGIDPCVLAGFRNAKVDEVMTKGAQIIPPNSLASEAALIMEENRINHLLVVENSKLIGAIGIHDLLEAKII